MMPQGPESHISCVFIRGYHQSFIHLDTLITLYVLRIHPHTFIEATQLFVELDVTSIQAGPCFTAGFVEVSVQDRAWFVPR
mgnify:CR=1 FL=1